MTAQRGNGAGMPLEVRVIEAMAAVPEDAARPARSVNRRAKVAAKLILAEWPGDEFRVRTPGMRSFTIVRFFDEITAVR